MNKGQKLSITTSEETIEPQTLLNIGRIPHICDDKGYERRQSRIIIPQKGI